MEKIDKELNTAHYHLQANLPSACLNIMCRWGRVKKKFNPTFDNPITMQFENCESKLKLWKEDDQWCMKIVGE